MRGAVRDGVTLFDENAAIVILQNNTEGNALAQALRQVMSRPHTVQGLLGRLCLLPLKEVFMGLLWREAAGVCWLVR